MKFSPGGGHPAFHGDWAPGEIAAQGQRGHAPRRGDPGKPVEPLPELAVGVQHRRCVGVAAPAHGELEGQHAAGARSRAPRPGGARSCGPAGRPRSAAPRRAPARRRPARAAGPARGPRGRGAARAAPRPRGQGAEARRGGARRARGPGRRACPRSAHRASVNGQHPYVDRRRRAGGGLLGAAAAWIHSTAASREQPRPAPPDEREQQALGEELADEADRGRPRRPTRTAISFSRRERAREQQVRHVGARDQQHQAHGRRRAPAAARRTLPTTCSRRGTMLKVSPPLGG